MGPLRREVMVPVPSMRRPSSLIGMSIVLVLLASAVDAVVWTYQAKREAEERMLRQDAPGLTHTDAARVQGLLAATPVTPEVLAIDETCDQPDLAIIATCDNADPLCVLE